jgi:hypothetical protein
MAASNNGINIPACMEIDESLTLTASRPFIRQKERAFNGPEVTDAISSHQSQATANNGGFPIRPYDGKSQAKFKFIYN